MTAPRAQAPPGSAAENQDVERAERASARGEKGKPAAPRCGSAWGTPAGKGPGQLLPTPRARSLWLQGDKATENAPHHSRALMDARAGPQSPARCSEATQR